MQLVIERSQADVKGVFGGHKGVQFTLSTRVVFTDDEVRLLDHYKLWDYSIMSRGPNKMPITLRMMADGDRQTVPSVEVLLSNEEVLKDALDSVPPLLGVLRSFGGNTTITYPRD